MKKILYILITFFSIQFISAQESELISDIDDVYESDAFSPKFNGGGIGNFYDFINKEFNFSSVKKHGKILVSFTIETSGELKDIRVIEFPNVEAAVEIIRVLNKSPNWQSATRNGKPFRTNIKLPLIFRDKINVQTVSTPVKQNVDTNSQLIKNTNIDKSTSVEKQPAKGIEKFYQFISANFQTPLVEGLKGNVIVSFVIDVDGSLTDIKVLKDIGYGTREEAIRVLKNCPKWTPGVQNGKPVKCAFTLPINIYSTQ